jgi:hypothetical protein
VTKQNNDRVGKRHLPTFVFTPNLIQTLQAALLLFEDHLTNKTEPLDKVALATQSVESVEEKINTLFTAGGLGKQTSFDYNESLVISLSVHMYAVDLLFQPQSEERNDRLQGCNALAPYFDYLVQQK